jgi:hypothetical protein
MKSVLAILFSIIVLASGCSKHSSVRLVTGPDATIKSVSIYRSSGDKKIDEKAIRLARSIFPKKIPKPRPNHTYIQPVTFKDKKPIEVQ